MQTDIILALLIYTSILLLAFLLLPYGLYKRRTESHQTLVQWLVQYDTSPKELIFSLLCLAVVMLFNAIHMVLPLSLSFYILLAGRKMIQKDHLAIKLTKKWIYTFTLAFTLYFVIQVSYLHFGIWKNATTIQDYRWIQLPIVCTIFSGIFFKVRLRDFNWSIDSKTILYVFALFAILKLSYVIATDLDSLRGLPVNYFIRNFIQQLYYPSLAEEVIFRGFLLSGLLSVGMDASKANILQAILFGLIHVISPDGITLIAILSTSFQVYVGFLIGKIYLSTKSLTPCIILHALIDTI